MRLCTWKEDYATGFPPIDHQHRYLLCLINKLIGCSDRDRVVLGSLLEEVVLFAGFHFRSEENGMLVHGYDAAATDRHLAAHGTIMRQLRAMADRYALDEVTLEEVIRFLLKWFSVHAMDEDRPLGRHLASCDTDAWQTHDLPPGLMAL